MPSDSLSESLKFMHTVALVEDDENTRELLKISIAKCRGFKLVGVYSAGPEALHDLPRLKPDVVLMDIKLPGMSGIECVRALRSLTPAFRSAILMLTEYADDRMIFDALMSPVGSN